MFCVNQKTARGNGCLIKAHYTVNKLSEPQVQHIEFFIFVRIKKKGGGGCLSISTTSHAWPPSLRSAQP